jgi:hypothetical protein
LSRVAIGYEPNDLERAVAVVVEGLEGVFLRTRGESQFPRQFTGTLSAAPGIAPGEPAYFDAVLDTLSTRWLIRDVFDEPTFLVTMLASDNVWDALPRARAVA